MMRYITKIYITYIYILGEIYYKVLLLLAAF